jgi:hypothetical protein
MAESRNGFHKIDFNLIYLLGSGKHWDLLAASAGPLQLFYDQLQLD